MAFTLQPAYGQGGSYSAQSDRLLLASMANTGGVRVITPKSGTTMTGDCAVNSSGTTDAKVSVGIGSVIIPWTTSSGQGYYHAYNDAALLSAALGANASGNPRIDVISLQVTDTGATPSVAIVVTAGTPAVSPIAPATPSNAVALAQVTVPNGFTGSTQVSNSNIADVRPKAYLPDLSVSATSTNVIASPSRGQMVYVADNTIAEGLQSYNGTAWRKPWNMPWGLVTPPIISTTTDTCTATEKALYTTASFTAVANRIYGIRWIEPNFTSASSSLSLGTMARKIRIGPGTGGTLLFQPLDLLIQDGSATSFDIEYYGTLPAGATVLVATGTAAASPSVNTFTRIATRPGQFIVEDLGPNGIPA